MYSANFTLDEITAVIKSLGISLNVAARKLPNLPMHSKVRHETQQEYEFMTSALEELRDVELRALTEGT